MINKVILEGVVTNSAWGKNKEAGAYFINIKQQERMFNNYKFQRTFPAYANRPLAAELAKVVEANPNCHLYIEGRLHMYLLKKDKSYRMTVLIEKFTMIGPKDEPVSK